MKITPLANRVHIAPVARAVQATQGKIFIPEKFNDPKAYSQYVVLAVGPGRLNKKKQRVPIELRPGDMVLTSLYLDHQVLEDGSKVVDADMIELAWRTQTAPQA